MKKKKWTKKQREQLKHYWECQKEATDKYTDELWRIETYMSDALGVEGVEFFWSWGSIVGICTAGRDYELLQYEDLE